MDPNTQIIPDVPVATDPNGTPSTVAQREHERLRMVVETWETKYAAARQARADLERGMGARVLADPDQGLVIRADLAQILADEQIAAAALHAAKDQSTALWAAVLRERAQGARAVAVEHRAAAAVHLVRTNELLAALEAHEGVRYGPPPPFPEEIQRLNPTLGSGYSVSALLLIQADKSDRQADYFDDQATDIEVRVGAVPKL